MKAYRLSRLLRPPLLRGVHVALEDLSQHTPGAEGSEHTIARLAEAAPDALHLSIGQADVLQSLPMHPRPALVLRADVNNLRGKDGARAIFSRIIEKAVEQAVRLDAAGVIVSYFHLPGETAVTEQCAANIQKLRSLCERWCIPLVVDMAAPAALARDVCAMGADVLKVDLPEDLRGLPDLVDAVGHIPVLVREDRKAEDGDILARARAAMDFGAAGIVCGRALSRHGQPGGWLRALSAALHESAPGSPNKLRESVTSITLCETDISVTQTNHTS